MENTPLECPMCHKNKINKLGENIKLIGVEGKKKIEFKSLPMKIFRCVTCGFYMLFDSDIFLYSHLKLSTK